MEDGGWREAGWGAQYKADANCLLFLLYFCDLMGVAVRLYGVDEPVRMHGG
jgi:hypothetical protein